MTDSEYESEHARLREVEAAKREQDKRGMRGEEPEPMKLQPWINAQTVGDEMLWKGAFGHQVGFIRDTLVSLVTCGGSLDHREAAATVISTHRSKSIALPVVAIDNAGLGLRIIVRDNFYNWKLSVISREPIHACFDGLFHTTPPIDPQYTGDPLSAVYFEGFPRDLVFGYYEPSDKRKWSAEIGTDQRLYTSLFLIVRALGAVKPYRWPRRGDL